jgi:hypothetical protein
MSVGTVFYATVSTASLRLVMVGDRASWPWRPDKEIYFA